MKAVRFFSGPVLLVGALAVAGVVEPSFTHAQTPAVENQASDRAWRIGQDRPVQIHNIYTNCPLNLHITPTLAMALQWAEAGTDKTWYSGPAFNAAINTVNIGMGFTAGLAIVLIAIMLDRMCRIRG